ncbi:MAG: hypothetical protein IKR89_02930 [Bacteroidaceae bacterium]|nr:hypothetical protein [Bacteroidaceae bacterium]
MKQLYNGKRTLELLHQLQVQFPNMMQLCLIGMSESEYSEYMQDKTAVSKGSDFVFKNIRYQVKANRPSGKKGSFVTKVPKASNYDWDKLIWILYDKNYVIQESMRMEC